MLRLSLPTGQFVVFDSRYYGVHIAVERKQWFSDGNKKYQERMVNVFRGLCGRGYIHHLRMCVFELTRPGFEAAYLLKDKNNRKPGESKLLLV